MLRKTLKTLAIALVAAVFSTAAVSAQAQQITLKYPVWGTTDIEYLTQINDISVAYKKFAPNVTIEVEQFKSSDDYENAMKIRFAAGEYPDLFGMKPYMLARYGDMMMDLSGQPAITNSLFPDAAKVNGRVVAAAGNALNEYVFYNKSLFAKAGVQVPQTWPEFIAVVKKLKAAGITPIVMGAKDVWPTYPFTEYMPALESGNGEYWNLMATQDEPFKAGTGIYKAYKKFEELVKAGAFDVKSAIGLGFDQAKLQFAAKKGAMMAAGMWFYTDFKDNIKGDLNDLGIFYLPVRDKLSDKLLATAQVDFFTGVPKGVKNPAESIKFLNWFRTSDYYKQFIAYYKALPAMKGVTMEEKFFDSAVANVSTKGGALAFVTYDGGNADYQKIANAVQFDVKRIGQEVIAGTSLDNIFKGLATKWKTARKK